MPAKKTVKPQYKISYYINGALVSTNNLRQPPDTLNTETLSRAISIVKDAHKSTHTNIQNATARITLGKELIKIHTVHYNTAP